MKDSIRFFGKAPTWEDDRHTDTSCRRCSLCIHTWWKTVSKMDRFNRRVYAGQAAKAPNGRSAPTYGHGRLPHNTAPHPTPQ
jgi:hypothetical protein